MSLDSFSSLNKRPWFCVGLDSDVEKLPKEFRKREDGQYDFNRWIIDQTAPYTDCYKPNIAFYEGEGPYGIWQLKQTVDYIKKKFPDKPVILDGKRADIESTNVGYVRLAYDYLDVDGVTLNPYLGREALQPFLERSDKMHFILGKTSNQGSGELQDLLVAGKENEPARLLWQIVAQKVATSWNTLGNCGLVLGATYPQQLKEARTLVGNLPLLIPGVGAQGGTVMDVLANGLNSMGGGVIINASRSVIFAPDPAKEARLLAKQLKG
jgi:orotidine-5'-phosphate decarboxylase